VTQALASFIFAVQCFRHLVGKKTIWLLLAQTSLHLLFMWCSISGLGPYPEGQA
jgi:hypothetical protein